MFGFGKKSKSDLVNEIWRRSVNAAEQFHSYLQEDPALYSQCINQNPIKTTSAIFVVNLYRDLLNCKYDGKDVFSVIYNVISNLSPDQLMTDLFMESLMEYMKACNHALEYYKQFPGFDPIDVITKTYFSLIIDKQEYLQSELDNAISNSVSYRKIYNYIDGLDKHQSILNEEYKLKRR